MKTLVTAALLAPLATGCIITTDDYSEDVGYITTEWSFRTTNGTSLDCPAGFPIVEVTAFPLDGSIPIIDLYNCERGRATAPYPIGEYDITIAVTNNSGSREYAHSLTRYVDIYFEDASVGEEFVDDGGRILFDWKLVDAESNESLTCDTVATIKVDATAGEATTSTELPCRDGFGVSEPLLAGAYTATFSALDANGRLLGEAQTKNVALDDRNDYDDLGTITLPIGGLAPPPTE